MIVRESTPSQGENQLDKVIAEYLREESAGQAGEHQQWLDRYPECAAGLKEFLADRDQLNQIMTPFRLDGAHSADGSESTGVYKHAQPDGANVTVDLAPAPPQFATPRYRPLRFHARGGMGEVWLARDEKIGRHVAIKKLREGRTDQQNRFLIEAQIAGQLEHPSVVPLHDLGTDDAGQAFYVMKFIEGRPLRETIAEFHQNKRRDDWPGDTAFVRLLQTFVSVCYAIAYAHSKGVMHRDIKPDNVMLGPFGETLILDWGLAKVVGQSEQPGNPSVKVSAGDSSTTQDGAIVGTLTYLSPEAARGNPDDVDQASDVYLLGGTLYEILTGLPPRSGSSQLNLIEIARRHGTPRPRQSEPSIPRALEAICVKALSFEKRERYPSAVALAEDMQRYLAGEPILAYQEPVVDRLARWARRHRRWIGQGLLLAGLLALAAFAILSHREAQSLTQREVARGRLAEFYRLADEAHYYAANVDSVSEHAPYYDPARATVVGEAAQRIAAPWREPGDTFPQPESWTAFQSAHYDLLLVLATARLGPGSNQAGARAALALLDTANEIQPPSRSYHRLRGQSLALLGQADAAMGELELAESAATPATAQDFFLTGERLRKQDVGTSADLLRSENPPKRKHLDEAIGAYRTALRLDPRHYWSRFQLGRCLLAVGRENEAIEALSSCIAIRPASPWAYAARGLASALSGVDEQALPDLNRAVELAPEFSPARLNRGIAYLLIDKLDLAQADFDAVLAAEPERRLAEASLYRGQILMNAGRLHEAMADFATLIAARPDFPQAYWHRAKVHFRLGEFNDGLADLATLVSLAAPDAKSEAGRRRLELGKVLRRMAQGLEGAAMAQSLARAHEELQAAVAVGPPTAEHYRELGAVQQRLGQLPRAIESYSAGLALAADDIRLRNQCAWAQLAAGQTDNARSDFEEAARLATDDPEAHTGLGYIMALDGNAPEAQAEALAATLRGANHVLTLHNVACIYGMLSQTPQADKVGYENLALAALTRAVELARIDPSAMDEVAAIRREKQSFSESLRSRAEFQQLLVSPNTGRK
jgi:tetratricopeptide (TPR) repeat protein/tRNA A-37 threonylcarbamoyl transferase component Bud32